MPRERKGFVSRRIELPADLDAAIVAAAEQSGEPLNTYIVRAAAKRAGKKYSPRARGRPVKPDASPAGPGSG